MYNSKVENVFLSRILFSKCSQLANILRENFIYIENKLNKDIKDKILSIDLKFNLDRGFYKLYPYLGYISSIMFN